METRHMAIDYGDIRVGIALSDPLKIFAYPLITIKNDNKLISEIINIIVSKKIEHIVIGITYDDNGDFSEYGKKTLLFVESLKKAICKTKLLYNDQAELLEKTKIILRDEFYTSKIASQNILDSTPQKKKRRDKGLVDKNAAAVLLKDYLENYEDKFNNPKNIL